ncbi:glycosyl transferase group 1 [Chthoniobacter flavus Ellin428]|uniref:Glycosyl transferase group 1 n=1 Tax=Chthoniobacter flavus Ellin428 TaxID=497964 RepID=B4D5F2_9BACT|nr:glycosyltransferase family 4 protein [Chthoniobacter flavus]EDY18357.1 glycosyl transferase group 1 [Chthoniobacter flavus Ellin428]TCO91379.1 glycosyltransferase involved in cell wall biosynthesis [Chthoniobacter flavus]
MKAAFVSVVPSPYQRDLFRALAQRPEVDLSVFYLEAAAPDSPWPEKTLEPYEKIMRGFWLPVGSARCHVNWPLPKLEDFDVVVMNTLMSFTAQWLMRTTLRHKPWFFWGERLGRGGKMHERLSEPLHRATGIAAIGTFADEDYRARFPEPQHFRIPYFCDLDPFLALPRHTRTNGQVVFLFCGQMIARKGVDLLLEAFQRLGGAARLLLVGREAELPQLLAPLPAAVRDRIIYAGFQAPEELPHFFAQADVFVLPSRYDGWGVVVNQALGAGLPIVCSDMVGAGRDLVEEEINGLRFPAGDAAALAEKMQRFIVQPSLCESWGQVSRRRARHWTPAAGAAKWVDVFQTALQS